MCNATGQCVAPDVIPCSPFICNGTRCFTACTTNNQCVDPFTCAANSCGLEGARRLVLGGHRVPRARSARRASAATAPATAACKSCTAGQLGVCTNVATGSPDPAGLCAVQDSVDLRHQRQVRGGRLPEVAVGHAVQARDLPDHHQPVHGGVRLRRRRRLRHADDLGLLPVSLRHRGLQAHVHRRRRLPAAGRVRRERTVRPQAERRGVRQQGRVPLQLLRAGRLLRERLHRRVQVVRAAGVARRLQQHRRRRRRHPVALRGPGRRQLRHRRTLRRQRRLPPVRRQHVVRRRRRARRTSRPRSTPAPATGWASARRRRRSPARPTSATARPRASARARATPTACRPTSAIRRPTAAATRSASARRARTPTTA